MWNAGYKQYINVTATTPFASYSAPTDFSYTILDSAAALTMSATTAVVLIAYSF